MTVPTMQDWNRTSAPSEKLITDECYAYSFFYSKTPEVARQLLEESAQYYIEDFTYMPLFPFQFYLPAFLDYLNKSPIDGDGDAALRFLNLIEHKVKFGEQTSVAALLGDIGASEDYYGSFRERVDQIYELKRSSARG